MGTLKPNRDKNLEIEYKKQIYLRYPIKTHLILKNDKYLDIVEKYVKPHIENGDFLLISERCIAVMQGRSYLLSEIHPSKLAILLSRFVSRHPGGIGLRSPWTMELALREAGIPRILGAAIISAITRPFGLKGLFYHLVGNDINAIDGPCDYTLPPGNNSAKLGPKDPMGVAKKINEFLKIPVAIIDANDYGVRVMGYSEGINVEVVKHILKDNPLGQTDEQTPMALVRLK